MSPLYNLPNELLIIIFRFCDVYTLSQISMVCRQFCRVSYMILNEKANHLLVTNQVSKKFCERCKPLLSLNISKFITHYNWKDGIFKERKVCELPLTFICNSGLQMTKNAVVFHGSNSLMAYNRTMNGTLKKEVIEICNSNIADITYCNDVIISSHRDGSLRFWRIQSQGKNTNYFAQLKICSNVHDENIYRLDATSQHILLSCQSDDIATTKVSVKLQKNTYEKDGCVERNELFYRNKSFVTSILFDPIGTKFAANINQESPIHSSVLIYDIDKRTSEFVHICDTSSIPEWGHDKLTCFSSDYLSTIMTGTENGKVILWDQRKSAPIQMYQISPTKHPDSNLNTDMYSNQFHRKNIRSIQFDSTHLYAVTYENLIEFDFKGTNLDHKKVKNFFLNYF